MWLNWNHAIFSPSNFIKSSRLKFKKSQKVVQAIKKQETSKMETTDEKFHRENSKT